MKATELRLNNYIASGEKYSETSITGKVLEIGNEEREFEQIYCECEESFEWFFKDSYCGIPLTEEWLVKFGFEWSIYHQANHKEGFRFDISEKYKDGYTLHLFKKKEIILEPFYYVHQLQNLYYCLCGEELISK